MMWRKKKAADEHYGGFNRRMWAATVDSLLIVLMTPLFNALAIRRPERDIDIAELQRSMAQQPDDRHALGVMWQAMVEAGVVDAWLVNTALQTLALCLLTAWCWRRWSATPGKMLLRLKVVDAATEAPLSDRQILLRLFGYFVSAFPGFLGFFWIGFDKKKQGWHDKIAGTAVVLKGKRD